MSNSGLFSEFSGTSRSDWEAKATKDLRGKSLDDLAHTDRDGILIQSYYTVEDRPSVALRKRPGRAKFVIQEILVLDEGEANSLALDVLNRGATGLLFYMLPNVDLPKLLEGIHPEYCELHFVQEGAGALLAEALGSYYESKGYDHQKCAGSINNDILENLARTGDWIKGEEEDWAHLTALVDRVDFAPWKTLCVNANLFHNAGATPATQVGIALSMLHEYLVRFGEVAAEAHWLNMAVGTAYFHDIAKLRSIRQLWWFLLEQYELDPESYPLHLHAETGLRDKTIYDPFNNMLRNTSASMAALVAGADSICVKPHDVAFKNPTEFSERIARNIPLILNHESYFDEIQDPSGGSYFIEALTAEISEKAWSVFKEIEAQGGYVEALKKGWLQDLVHGQAAEENDRVTEGEKKVLGVNLYPKEEKMAGAVEQAMFCRDRQTDTEVEPIRMQRWSEGLESKRLNDEA